MQIVFFIVLGYLILFFIIFGAVKMAVYDALQLFKDEIVKELKDRGVHAETDSKDNKELVNNLSGTKELIKTPC